MTYEEVLKLWIKCLGVAFVLIMLAVGTMGSLWSLFALVGVFVILFSGSIAIFKYFILGEES